jgi:hypothetical protein
MESHYPKSLSLFRIMLTGLNVVRCSADSNGGTEHMGASTSGERDERADETGGHAPFIKYDEIPTIFRSRRQF